MYLIIIMPLIAGAVAEILKFIIPSNKKKLSFKNFFTYSGMPSGHSTVVASLVTIIGLREGIDSVAFGFSFIFALLVIRDAIGLRQYLGHHGAVLNVLVKDLRNDNVLEEHYPHLRENIGHTHLQVLAGIVTGVLVSVIGYIIF
jgi:uncharacterized protein